MASVFSFKHNFGKSDGRLRRDQLMQLWKEPEYPRELHHVLLKLLEKFEIILPLPMEGAAPQAALSASASSTSPRYRKYSCSSFAAPTFLIRVFKVSRSLNRAGNR